MKRLLTLAAGLIFSLQAWSNAAQAQQRLATGFYSPTGTNPLHITHGWLDSGCGPGEPYEFGFYHLGADNPRPFGSSVYAIWDGVVTTINSGGWGDGNVAVVVKSKLHTGSEFLWLVGHVHTNLHVGEPVTRGQVMATVGHWPDGDHLHVGMFPGTTLPPTDAVQHIGWGKMGCGHWIDAHTFLSTFGGNPQWDPKWELRWATFSFTQNRAVKVYHATYKDDAAQRFVGFSDPDLGTWNGWSAASGSVGAPSRDIQAKQDMLDRSLREVRFVGRPKTNGFVDAIEWVTTQTPDDPVNTQAESDILKRALSDSRFVGSGQHFFVDVNWDPAWELRATDFSFAGGRMVTIWQVTQKANSSVRYTGFFDPDRGNAWTGWKKV